MRLHEFLSEYLELYGDDLSDIDYDNLSSAANKVQRGSVVYTQAEKEMVQHALEDGGELYLYAGTSSGYTSDEPHEDRRAGLGMFMEAKSRGLIDYIPRLA